MVVVEAVVSVVRDPVKHPERGQNAHRLKSSAGCAPQPEVTTSSLKLLPDTSLNHFHFNSYAEVGLFTLRLCIS